MKNFFVIIVWFLGLMNIAFAQSPASVKVINDVRYAPKIEASLNDVSCDRFLDIYLPENTSESSKLPVFMFIHGGGFSGGDKSQTKGFCERLASKGVAVVSINYLPNLKLNRVQGVTCRSNMSEGLPASGKFHPALSQAIDIASVDASLALKWIKDNAKKYHFDVNKITVSGGSAGAMTALYMGLCKKNKIKIAALVNFFGGLENNDYIVNYKLPVLTFHGNKDDLISVEYAHSLHQFLEKKNNTHSKLVIMDGVGHASHIYITSKIPVILDFLASVYTVK
ncbi:alpha/beta hydrolase [Pseudopedobacter beijingensis]|uniref:Alpha/beta hydrolase n=1 Tax=Pseudopedobacter beijingensis TaxID=1207056 RepID=A0ABW4IHE7_9SPHI